MLVRAAPLLVLALALTVGIRPARGDEAPPRPSGGTHLDLEFDRVEHDFGTIGQNEEVETTFTYTNTSDHAVERVQERADCGCNVVELSARTLEPGESGTLKVVFHTAMLSGTLMKRVRVTTGDVSRGEVMLRLRISILAGLIVDPGAVSFRDVAFGTKPTAHFGVKWYEGIGKPFEVTEVTVPGHEFSVAVGKYTPAADEQWRGFRVELTFKETPPLGMYSAEVLVRTTHPDYPRLTLPLSANVVGKIWMQSRTLHFGVVPEGTERTSTLKFRPQHADVVFGEVTARSRSGRLRVEVGPDPRHEEKGYWILSATVPSDAEPGRLDDEVIELRTGVPGEEQIDVKVRGRVRGARR